MSLGAVRRTALRAAGATGLGGLGYGYYLYETDEGVRRAVWAYKSLVPVVLHYRLLEARHKLIGPVDDSEWRAMDERYAEPTVAKLRELQGMYVKYGQTSAGLTNTFGPAWIKELRSLENQVPPRPIEVVHRTIEQETGKPVEETFSEFDPEPMGSASIGQVHRARLKRDGKLVCVKVQYPDAERLFRTDMHAIRLFCETLAPEHVVTLSALERQNVTELDYLNEANSLLEIADNMKKHGFMPNEVEVPMPVMDFTTKRMLVMELLSGDKLIDGCNAFFAEWARKQGTTLAQLEQEARHRIDTEGVPSKYDGPGPLTMSLYRRYLVAWDAVVNSGIFLYNYSFGLATSRKATYQKSIVPPNIPRIIDVLMRVHGCQLFKDGMFQSDPHGGNFLLMPDGRIGLIDYGSTKHFTRNERLTICLLYAALYRKDQEKLFQMSEIGGYKSKYGRKDVLYKLIQFGYNDFSRDLTGGKNLQQFIDELKTQDPWEETPDNFVLAQFMSIRLRSLALGMNHPIKCSEWWGPIAEQTLNEEGLPYESWTHEQMLEHKPELSMQRHKFG